MHADPQYELPYRGPHFDGRTYEAALDYDRLGQQLVSVLRIMRDGQWRTLYQLAELTGWPVQSISARLRDLRKDKFGSHHVERQRVKAGLFQYRLILNQELTRPNDG